MRCGLRRPFPFQSLKAADAQSVACVTQGIQG